VLEAYEGLEGELSRYVPVIEGMVLREVVEVGCITAFR